jgi:hypothetical protein
MLGGYPILLIIIDSSFLEIVKLKNCLLRVLKKSSKSNNCQFRLFQKPQRTNGFHDITSKVLTVSKVVIGCFPRFLRIMHIY